MQQWIFIAIGGAIGAILPSFLSSFPNNESFPYGTLLVNLLGCFLIGLLWKLFDQSIIPQPYKPLLTTGFLGALTTFSTFSLDNFFLLEQEAWGRLALNLFVSCGVGLFAVWLGVQLVTLLFR